MSLISPVLQVCHQELRAVLAVELAFVVHPLHSVVSINCMSIISNNDRGSVAVNSVLFTLKLLIEAADFITAF